MRLEEVDWEVKDVTRVENADEDRFIIYSGGDYFVCEIEAGEEDTGAVRCYCE